MFGINSFEQVGDIIEGHYKEITNQENELYQERIKICKKCPLYSDKFGGLCDPKKCWNTVKNTSEDFPGKNIKCGCGCRLSAKLRLKNTECVLNKW